MEMGSLMHHLRGTVAFLQCELDTFHKEGNWHRVTNE